MNAHYELIVSFKAGEKRNYKRLMYRSLDVVLNKLTELSKYDIEYISIEVIKREPIDSVQIRKVTVDELFEMICQGDSDATI